MAVGAAIAGAFGSIAGLVVLVASVPLLFAWGAFQADLAMNAPVDEVARSRWRIALYLLPWSVTVYWLRYVRPRAEPG